MKAKEFYEKNRGLYFRYNDGETVRVVGYNTTDDKIIITYCMGWSYLCKKTTDYIDDGLIIYADRFCPASQNELSEINPLNLCQLLAGREGETFYSTVVGVCKIDYIRDNRICVIGSDSIGVILYGDGKHSKFGECTLFPSKENRDWSTYKPNVVLPENSVVMVAEEKAFRLRFYRSKNKCYSDGLDGSHSIAVSTWKYIVPIADYDSNATFEENCKKSIV